MNVLLDINTLLNGVILIGVGAGVRSVRAIHQELRKLNGRLIEVETRQEDQEKMCKIRHHEDGP